MKLKKLMLSMFAVAVTAVAAGGLSSCGGDNNTTTKPNTNITLSETDLDKVNAALGQLKIDNTYTSNFSLTVRGIGGVAIAYQSSNTDVFNVASDGSVTITRPAFGQPDAKITLKATLTLNDAKVEKTFEITIPSVVDESKTVSEIKNLEDKTIVYAKGAVTGFLYGGDEEHKMGFYLTDSTGTIYVYGPTAAEKVNTGNYVYVGGTKDSYTGNKDTQLQYTTPQLSADSDKLTIVEDNAAIDTTSYISDKSISQLNANPMDALTNVYEFVCFVDVNSYGAFNLTDVFTNEQILLYYSGSTSADKTYVYDDVLEEALYQIVKVRYYVNSLNSSGKIRGNVLSVLEITNQDKVDAVVNGVANLLSSNYLITTEVQLNSVWDEVTLNVSGNENIFEYDLENQILTIKALEEETTGELAIKAVANNGATATKKVTITTKDNLPIIREGVMTHDQYVAAAKNANVKVEGIVQLIVDDKNRIICDDAGNYYLIYGLLSEKYAIGDRLVITGAKDIYNGMHEVKAPSGGTMEIVKIKNEAIITQYTYLNDYICENNEFVVNSTNQATPTSVTGYVKELSEDGRVLTLDVYGFDIYVALNSADKDFLTKFPVGTLVDVNGYFSYNTANKDKESQISALADIEKGIFTSYLNYLFAGKSTITSATSFDLSNIALPEGTTLRVDINDEAKNYVSFDSNTKVLSFAIADEDIDAEVTFNLVENDGETSYCFNFKLLALTDEQKVDQTIETIQSLFEDNYEDDALIQINRLYDDTEIVAAPELYKTIDISAVGTSYKVLIKPVSTEVSENLVFNVTCGTTTKSVTIIIKSKQDYNLEEVNANIMDHTAFISVADKGAVKVKGVVSYIMSSSAAFIYDENGNGYYLYKADIDKEVTLGEELVVVGTKSVYNNVIEVVPTDIYRIDALKDTLTPTNITESVTANGLTVNNTNQNSLIAITGIIKSISTDNKTIIIKTGEKEVTVYLAVAEKDLAKKLFVGNSIIVIGIQTVYKTNSQIGTKYSDVIDDSTDQDKGNAIRDIIKSLFEEKYEKDAKISLDVCALDGFNLALNTASATQATYNSDTKELSIAVSDTEITNTISFTMTLSISSENVTTINFDVTFKTKKKAEMASGDTATVEVLSNSTSNTRDLTTDTADNAEILNLDPEIFEVSFNKNDATTAARAAIGSIKLYNKKDSTNGGDITIAVKEGYTIQTIKITFASTNASNTYVVKAGTTEVTATDGVYTINGTSFTIQNTDEPNNQLHIASIELVFKKN